MRKTLGTVLCALIFAIGCDSMEEIAGSTADWFFEDEENCECGNHYLILNEGQTPEKGEVVIRVSNGYGDVDIQVFDGSMQSGLCVKDTTSAAERNTFDLPVNREYTYVARYLKNSDTIIVPVKTKLECKVNECKGLQCYFLKNNIIDLSLRF